MAEKQIQFPPEQTHQRWFSWGMMLFSIASAIVVIIIVVTYEHGAFIGPW